jgi:small subunit ribosomal protein S4e
MGKKGGRRHLKRKPAPEFWPIHRKEAVWTVKPNAGPHPISRCIPLTLVLRDILGVAKTRSEVKTIVHEEKIMVDGKVQREELFPTGLMDVVSIPDMEKWYRVLPYEKGLFFHPISKDEAAFKLCRIENKKVLFGGNVQLNLHDGRNVLVKVKDPNKPEEDVFGTLDTLKINLPNQEILGHMKLAEGAPALIVGGKNAGKHGKIVAIEQRSRQKRKNSLVTVEDEKGNRFQTTVDYVFVIGDKQPHISLPEAS